MFTLIEGVLLRPLPVRQQDRLLVAWKALPSRGLAHFPFRVHEMDAIRRESQLLEDVAALGYNGSGPSVAAESGAASYISTASVTGDFFRVTVGLVGGDRHRDVRLTGHRPRRRSGEGLVRSRLPERRRRQQQAQRAGNAKRSQCDLTVCGLPFLQPL